MATKGGTSTTHGEPHEVTDIITLVVRMKVDPDQTHIFMEKNGYVKTVVGLWGTNLVDSHLPVVVGAVT